MGGENSMSMVGNLSVWGSSPRGRGKPVAGALGALCPRLIPAWAGKTNVYPHDGGSPGAHPRVGGENEFDTQTDAHAWGSSPRGRGKPCHAPTCTGPCWLIPAWAGKTTNLPSMG